MFSKSNLSYFKNDIPSGLVVSLVALPLCFGIAQGSEAEPFAGIIAGFIGGIVVTIFSGSKFGVSGPAAGLITIVVAAITDLGYEGFLLALAGALLLTPGFVTDAVGFTLLLPATRKILVHKVIAFITPRVMSKTTFQGGFQKQSSFTEHHQESKHSGNITIEGEYTKDEK